MADGFGDLSRRLDLLSREMTGEAARKRLADVGMATKGEVRKAVMATPTRGAGRSLTDASMSGWRKSNPIAIEGRFDVLNDSQVEISPARKARGPMRVLESGRQAYAAGDRRKSGTYTSKKTGVTKDKFRTAKRASGATAGKGTWTAVTKILEREMPARYAVAFGKSIAKHIKGG